jgi:hypothetical protein
MDKPNAKWTVMVYMAASDSPELDAHAVRDLQEMERAKIDPNVNVFVQIDRHWPALPQRYVVVDGGAVLVEANVLKARPAPAPGAPPLPPLTVFDLVDKEMAPDTGRKETLLDFLDWAHRLDEKATHFFLILWGHAYGLGFGRDHGDPLTMSELRNALEAFANTRGKKLDLLGANACAMSYAEAAYELRTGAEFLVASQIAVPFAGWPYDAILGTIAGTTDALTLGKNVATEYVARYRGSASDRVSMSLLQLDALDGTRDKGSDLNAHLKGLATALTEAIDSSKPGNGDRLHHVRAAFLATAAGDVRPLIDLVDLCAELEAMCDDLEALEGRKGALTSLQRAATTLRTRLTSGGPVVKAVEPALTPESDGMHGIGIFAPFVTDERDLQRLGLGDKKAEAGRDCYKDLALITGTGWEQLVFDSLKANLPADVLSGIEGSGATSRADRTGVAQMLVSVDAIFDTLDRRLEATRIEVLREVKKRADAAGPAPSRPSALILLLEKKREEAAAYGRLNAPDAAGNPAEASSEVIQTTTRALNRLELRIADVERAVYRTLTNEAFGLGPGRDTDGPKPLLGAPEPKPLLGAPEPKPLLGLPGTVTGATAGDASPMAIIASLFEQVGSSLRNLESAAADLEKTAMSTLGPGGSVAALPPAGSDREVERAFRVCSEAVEDARRTLIRVLSHPVYGFGPGSGGVSAADRQALARAGGMNNRSLSLLSFTERKIDESRRGDPTKSPSATGGSADDRAGAESPAVSHVG